MKNLFSLLFLCTLSVICLAGDGIKANVSHCVFQSPDQGPYLETYLSIEPSSVNWTSSNGQYQAAVEVTMLLKNEAGEIIKADKFNLMSPEVDDPKAVDFTMVDLKRFQLHNGQYTLDIKLNDATAEIESTEMSYTININAVKSKIQVSDVMLIEKFEKVEIPSIYTKNGYDLTPNTNNYYPHGFNLLSFYAEVYNTHELLESSDYFIRYYIAKDKKSVAVNNLVGFTKQKAAPVNVVFSSMDITELSSGNYDLVLEVRNDKNELITEKRTFFQRNNGPNTYSDLALSEDFAKEIPQDKLIYRLESLYPLADLSQSRVIERLAVYETWDDIRVFINDFFVQFNPANPAMDYAAYALAVDVVERDFATEIEHGFETDRGWTFLKYGPPDVVKNESHNNDAFPYFIWQYYQLDEIQSNRKFIFASKDRSTNDFQLVHSDARGEINNPRWKLDVQKIMDDNIDYGTNSRISDDFESIDSHNIND